MFQLATAFDVAVAEGNGNKFAAGAPQDADAAKIGKGRSPTRQRNGLHHVDGAPHYKVASLEHLADNEHPVTSQSLDGHRDHGFRHELTQPRFEVTTDLVHAAAGGEHIARQREAQAAIRADDHFALQFLLAPNAHLQDVTGLQQIGIGGRFRLLRRHIGGARGERKKTQPNGYQRTNVTVHGHTVSSLSYILVAVPWLGSRAEEAGADGDPGAVGAAVPA